MSSLSKQKKRSKGLKVKQCDDRITSLPNCLITKILSCLPTKDAVATSVLSTKWKRSWVSITNLDFDDKIDEISYEADEDVHKVKKFTEFVTRVLLLRESSCLQRVRLKCYRDCDDSFVNEWLTTIIQCNVQELDITISIPSEHPLVRLPSDIFLSNNLVVLKLSMCDSCLPVPTSVCLYHLKTLHLHRVYIRGVEPITNLISSCPVLEELSLCNCSTDVRKVKIIAHVLKTLIVNYNWEYELVIDAPSLEYFDFKEYFTEVYLVNNMAHLNKAVINFSYYGEDAYTDEFKELHSGAVNDFLKKVSQVKNLSLSEDSVRVLSSYNLVLPQFNNLTYLKFETVSRWCILAKLLENSPSLESLYIRQGKCEVHSKIGTLPFRGVPSCFLFHLKETDIGYFDDRGDEIEVVEYILKNAKVLEKLTLHYDFQTNDTVGKHAEFFRKLLSFPRASAICKVLVCDL